MKPRSVAWTVLVSACAGTTGPTSTESPPAAVNAHEQARTSDAGAADAKNPSLRMCSDLVAADDGLIDDGEDGDFRILDAGGRVGGWMAQHDNQGSSFEIPKGDKFTMAAGGVNGSSKAARAKGKAASGEGAFAFVNMLLQAGGFYDASKYAGISFWAKSNGLTRIRFRVSDVNTASEGKICKVCWNDFGKTIELGPSWTQYTISFAELVQSDGPADPRPPHLEARQLFALAWNAEPGKDFDFWIDDVGFVRCK